MDYSTTNKSSDTLLTDRAYFQRRLRQLRMLRNGRIAGSTYAMSTADDQIQEMERNIQMIDDRLNEIENADPQEAITRHELELSMLELARDDLRRKEAFPDLSPADWTDIFNEYTRLNDLEAAIRKGIRGEKERRIQIQLHSVNRDLNNNIKQLDRRNDDDLGLAINLSLLSNHITSSPKKANDPNELVPCRYYDRSKPGKRCPFTCRGRANRDRHEKKHTNGRYL